MRAPTAAQRGQTGGSRAQEVQRTGRGQTATTKSATTMLTQTTRGQAHVNRPICGLVPTDANHSGTSTCEQAHLPICGLVPTRMSVCRVRAGLQCGSSILDHCAVSVKLQFASKLCSTIIIRRVCIQYTLNNRMNCKLNGAIMCKNKIIIARLVENSNTLHKVNQCTTQVNACSLHVHNIHDTNQR